MVISRQLLRLQVLRIWGSWLSFYPQKHESFLFCFYLILHVKNTEGSPPETPFMGGVKTVSSACIARWYRDYSLFRPSAYVSLDAGRETSKPCFLGTQEADFPFLCFVILHCDLIMSGTLCGGNL